jgi:hypothetical protein
VEDEGGDKLEGYLTLFGAMRMGHLYFDNWLDDVTDDVMEEEAVIGNQEGSERDQL